MSHVIVSILSLEVDPIIVWWNKLTRLAKVLDNFIRKYILCKHLTIFLAYLPRFCFPFTWNNLDSYKSYREDHNAVFWPICHDISSHYPARRFGALWNDRLRILLLHLLTAALMQSLRFLLFFLANEREAILNLAYRKEALPNPPCLLHDATSIQLLHHLYKISLIFVQHCKGFKAKLI